MEKLKGLRLGRTLQFNMYAKKNKFGFIMQVMKLRCHHTGLQWNASVRDAKKNKNKLKPKGKIFFWYH